LYYLDDNKNIFNIFDITDFNQLNLALDNIAPSLCEYYLNDLISTLSANEILNKSNIQDIINLDLYNIYLDYNNKIFIENLTNNQEYDTPSFW
jgi:hypothetical protein